MLLINLLFFHFLLLLVCPKKSENLYIQPLLVIHGTLQQNHLNPDQNCSFVFSFASKQAHLFLTCRSTQIQKTYNVSEIVQNHLISAHFFQLIQINTTKQTALFENKMNVIAKLGIQWEYNITLADQNNEVYQILGKVITNSYNIPILYAIYTLICLIILPPYTKYYQYIKSMNLLSFLLSMFLSLSVFANCGFSIFNLLSGTGNMQMAVSVIALVIAFVSVSLHMYLKNRIYLLKLFGQYGSERVKNIIFGCCCLILGFGFDIFYKIHKDFSTYFLFAGGAVIYMTSFLIFRSMKKFYFSFRIVCFDVLSILLLVICSRVYPILFYQIPNFQHLVGSYLLCVVLLISGLATYILINVLGKDLKKSIDQTQIDDKKEGDQGSHKKIRQSKLVLEEGDNIWKQVKHQSMGSSQYNGSEVIQAPEQLKFTEKL